MDGGTAPKRDGAGVVIISRDVPKGASIRAVDGEGFGGGDDGAFEAEATATIDGGAIANGGDAEGVGISHDQGACAYRGHACVGVGGGECEATRARFGQATAGTPGDHAADDGDVVGIFADGRVDRAGRPVQVQGVAEVQPDAVAIEDQRAGGEAAGAPGQGIG